jgi:predicted secreted acid phosphatase
MAKKALETSLSQVALVRASAEKYLNLVRELRPWWVVLVPFLAWRGKKTYDKEFRRILDEMKTEASTVQAEVAEVAAKQTRAEAKALRAQAKAADKLAKKLQAEAKKARKG